MTRGTRKQFALGRLAGLLTALSLAATAAAAPVDGVAALQAFYEKVDSLRASFVQVQVDDAGHVLQRMAGLFLLKRPDSFRWEYTEPYRQIIVSDGDTFRFYDVGLAQVTIRPVGDGLHATPAQLLAGGTALGEAFQVSAAGRHGGLEWVRLNPRSEDSDFEQVRIGLQGATPAVMELDDKLGGTTRIEFEKIETNVNIAGQRFTVEIPEGVTVVDARNQP